MIYKLSENKVIILNKKIARKIYFPIILIEIIFTYLQILKLLFSKDLKNVS